MKLTIKSLTGKQIFLEAQPEDLIQNIKKKIEDKEGIPIDQQNLVHNGKQLQNIRSLSDYQIPNDSTIHLILRLRKPIILFYGFKGPFSCQVKTQHPQHFVCFPKCKTKAIRWEGQIKDNNLIIDGQKYPYLFWEHKRLELPNLQPHFKMSREEIGDKVFSLLSRLGLNQMEAANFVTYWVHTWTTQPHWFVHILDEGLINKMFPLEITPQPKQIKRIYLIFGAAKETDCVNQDFQINEWKMTEQETVIEWGSSQYVFN